MDFLLAWFTKFITLYFLEISQEGMLKLTVKESVSVKLRLELRYLSSSMLWFMSTFVKDVDALKNYYLNMKQSYYIEPFYLIVVNGNCFDKDVPLSFYYQYISDHNQNKKYQVFHGFFPTLLTILLWWKQIQVLIYFRH